MSRFDPKVPKTVEESVQDLIERAHSYLRNRTVGSEDQDESSSRASSTKSIALSSKRSSILEKEENLLEPELKKAIVNQYGMVEVAQSTSKELGHPDGESRGFGTKIGQDSSEEELAKDLLDQELKLLDLKKRQRKKIESKKYTNHDGMFFFFFLFAKQSIKLIQHM